MACQGYDQRRWADVVELWSVYNRHLAHVVARIPEDKGATPYHIGHYPEQTLRFVARDYVGHLQHHLGQIFDGG